MNKASARLGGADTSGWFQAGKGKQLKGERAVRPGMRKEVSR